MTTTEAAALGVDGGNSKTDLALVAADGSLIAAIRGPTVSHQSVPAPDEAPLEARVDIAGRRLTSLVDELRILAGAAPGGRPIARHGVFCLAGADFRPEVRLLERGLRHRGFVDEAVVLNDAFAPLRAGMQRDAGVALICGAGVNAAGIGPDGRTARLAAVGDISGDWGGGSSLGMAALGAAVRARDGRGPRTSLEHLAPAHFGMGRPITLTEALNAGRIETARLRELSPVVFAAAMDGDAVAREIVDRLAIELATMALAIARRLHVIRRGFDVVLAGGVFRTDDAAFYAEIEQHLLAGAPLARLVRLATPPVAGAALLALDRRGTVSAAAADRLREALAAWDRRAAKSAPRIR